MSGTAVLLSARCPNSCARRQDCFHDRRCGREPRSWEFDAHCLATHTPDVLALSRRVRRAFTIPASDILVTKTMLGVFGCVPAFDRYFRLGFGCQTLCSGALVRIGTFYREDQAATDAHRVFTLDLDSGRNTDRRYSRAKIIDMNFFQEGFNRERSRS